MRATKKKTEDLPQITLITASVFLKWLTEAINEIYEELGKKFIFKIYFLNDLDSGNVPENELISSIYKSEIMLLDIRGNSPTVEILVNTYKKMEEENPDPRFDKRSAVWSENDPLLRFFRESISYKNLKTCSILGYDDGLLGIRIRWYRG